MAADAPALFTPPQVADTPETLAALDASTPSDNVCAVCSVHEAAAHNRLWILMTYQNLEAAYRLWAATVSGAPGIGAIGCPALLQTWSGITVRALDAVAAAPPLQEATARCPICLAAPVDRVLIPCGHTLCSVCAPHLTACMLCRAPVDRAHPCYI